MTGLTVHCKTMEEALDVLQKHELENSYCYSTIKATKGFGNIGKIWTYSEYLEAQYNIISVFEVRVIFEKFYTIH